MSANPIDEAVRALIAEARRAANVLHMTAHPHESPHKRPLLDAAANAEATLTAAQQQGQGQFTQSDMERFGLHVADAREERLRQQPGQACECPIPVDDPPDMHAPGCVVRQPKQQGQAGLSKLPGAPAYPDARTDPFNALFTEY